MSLALGSVPELCSQIQRSALAPIVHSRKLTEELATPDVDGPEREAR